MRLQGLRTKGLRIGLIGVLALVALVGAGVGLSARATAAATYKPQTRAFTVIGVPLLVHEQTSMLDYLTADFAAGGVLDGKEVYGFLPSTLVVYQGDTVNLTLVNPADDDHTFTIADLNVSVTMKGQSASPATFTASKVGVFSYVCAESEHMPFMWGQLIVLPDSAATAS